jgi:predicted DNA-binding transcriptional regulator AlpA
MSATNSPPAAGPAALLDVRAVAALLNCSPRHVYRLADGGQMPPPVKLGSLVRWKLDGPGGLREWIDAGCPRHRK